MKKYTVSAVIELPRHRVVTLYDDPDNLDAWQDGLESVERRHGDPGQTGARSRLVFQNGKHRIELFETITMRSLPDEIHGLYEWSGGRNRVGVCENPHPPRPDGGPSTRAAGRHCTGSR